MKQSIFSNQRGLTALKDHQSLIFNVLQGTLIKDEAKKTLQEGLDEVMFKLNSAIVEEGAKLLRGIENDDIVYNEEKEALERMEDMQQHVRYEEEKYLGSYGGQ